jgi:hypothetical protein
MASGVVAASCKRVGRQAVLSAWGSSVFDRKKNTRVF